MKGNQSGALLGHVHEPQTLLHSSVPLMMLRCECRNLLMIEDSESRSLLGAGLVLHRDPIQTLTHPAQTFLRLTSFVQTSHDSHDVMHEYRYS